MKEFGIAVLFIALVFLGVHFTYQGSSDHSKRAGLDRPIEYTQAQEDIGIHQVQRKGINRVPREEKIDPEDK